MNNLRDQTEDKIKKGNDIIIIIIDRCEIDYMDEGENQRVC